MTDTTGTGDLIKRFRFYHERLVHGEPTFATPEDFAQAADALEAAERVIAWIAEHSSDVFAQSNARDWLARHATGQKGGDDD